MFKTFLEEYKAWCLLFNLQISLFVVGSSFSVMHSQYHTESVLFIFLIVAAVSSSSGKFPSLIKKLRAQKLNEHQAIVLAGLSKRYFGVRAAFVNFLPYTISCFFAASVGAGVWY